MASLLYNSSSPYLLSTFTLAPIFPSHTIVKGRFLKLGLNGVLLLLKTLNAMVFPCTWSRLHTLAMAGPALWNSPCLPV